MSKSASAPTSVYIADYEAQKLIDLAKSFFADPKNAAAYRQWHYDNYGYWPEDEQCATSGKPS